MELWVWWLIAGIALVVAELASGTFYLLVLGAAALLGAVVAYAGGAFVWQTIAAGTLALAGVFYIRSRRSALGGPDMPSLDVGQVVTLEIWVNQADARARVKYRDTLWDAIVEGVPGRDFRGEAGETFYITAVDGSTLRVAKQKQPWTRPA